MTDRNFLVLYKKENMKKNRILLPKKKVYYTFELPKGKAKNIKINTSEQDVFVIESLTNPPKKSTSPIITTDTKAIIKTYSTKAWPFLFNIFSFLFIRFTPRNYSFIYE